MSLMKKDFNQRLVKEITIKHIWFDAPTIPKNFDNQVAERIAGTNSQIKETR